MKKLMIAFAAVAMAVVANAATCNWSGSAIALSTSTGAGAATSYTLYLMDPTVVAIADITEAFTTGGNYTSMLGEAVKTTNGIAVSTTSARWNESGWGSFTANESYTYYTVVLNNSISAADQYMITGPLTKTAPSSGSLQMGFGSQASNTWADIASVPEPTSGLLLLLGMAGLALKRKQA